MPHDEDSKYFTDPKYMRLLYRGFCDTHNILLKHGIGYYASGGTLIGALRHRGIINWDDDVDLEVSYKDIEKILSPEVKADFKKAGYKVVVHRESKNDLDWIKINSIKKANGKISSLDLFPVMAVFDRKVGKYRTRHYSDFTAGIWPKEFHYLNDIYPLKQVTFGALVINIPNKPKPYLYRGYGKNVLRQGYITMDQDHMPLDKPIKVGLKDFTPGKHFHRDVKQVRLSKSDPLLTGMGLNLL
jgi:hypothetical protein